MGKFKQSLITTAGKSILLGGEVTYTSAKLFSQDVSSMTDDQVRALTALTGQLMSVGVSVEAMDNSTVSVKAVFSNKGLTDDLTFSSVGWFAKAGSGTETLIAVTPIEGTKLLGAGLPNSSTDAINIAMNMAIGDSTTVNVVIDPAGTVSPVDLDSAISKIQTDVDTKATKDDVDKEITTLTADKANASDVYTKEQVDGSFSTRDNNINSLINQVKQIDGETVISDAVDVNTLVGETGKVHVYKCTNAGNTNTPSWIDYKDGYLITLNWDGYAKTQLWFPVSVGNSAQFDIRYWEGSNASSWNHMSTTDYVDSDITNLQNQIQAQQTKLTDDVYTKPEVDSKTSGTVVTAYDIASKKPTTVTNSYTSEELVDQGVLGQFADQINQLKGRQAVDAPDFNTLTDSGTYFVSNPQNGKNFPTNKWGTLAVFNGSGQRIEQIYFDDGGTNAFMRTYGWSNNAAEWYSWNRIAWQSDITSLQNVVNGKANSTDVSNLQSMITGLSTKVDSATTKLQGQITEIQSKNYIEGYNCANESDAETYSKAHPNTLVTVS